MSSKNEDTSAAAMVFGLLCAMAVLMYFALVFVSFVLTILSIIAWNRPLHLGKICIEPYEARAFVKGGLIGAALLPLFLAFINVFFGVHIEWRYLPHILAFGYTGGSLLVLKSFASEDGGLAPHHPPENQVVLPPERKPQLPEPKPFSFATWDDEEHGT